MDFKKLKAKACGARHSLTMKINATIVAVGGFFITIKDALSALSDLLVWFLPSARDYLLQSQSILDPTIFKYVGSSMALIGLANMALRGKTKDALEDKPQRKETDEPSA